MTKKWNIVTTVFTILLTSIRSKQDNWNIETNIQQSDYKVILFFCSISTKNVVFLGIAFQFFHTIERIT